MEPASRDNLAQLKLTGTLVRLDALQPDGFTAQQLAETARVELETARAFLKKELVPEAKVPATGIAGRGRPANLYLLSASRRAELIGRLVAIRQELDLAEGIGGPSRAELFAPLELLEETLSELEAGSDTVEEWRDRQHEARLELTSAMADGRELQSRESPEAIEFSKRITELQTRFAILERRGPPSSETAAHHGFGIKAERWEETGHKDAAVRLTGAPIRISVADNVATRNVAPWLDSVRDSAPLAAYPLALWLIKYWWRLRWEPAAISLKPKPSWRAAHELTIGADKGFEWPPLVICSQGDSLFATCSPEEHHYNSGLRYLDSFRASISGTEFECAVDKFVEQTIARLNGLSNLELCGLLDTLTKDRADPKRSSYRRREALLGFNTDEASPELIGAVDRITAQVDPLAVDELVSAFGTDRHDDLNSVIGKTENIIYSTNLRGRILRSLPTATLQGGDQPWEIGKRLAGQSRSVLGFGLAPISDNGLGDLLSLTGAQIADAGLAGAEGLPFGVAICNVDNDNTNFLFRRTEVVARRFEAARFIADAHLSPPGSTWMLETDTRTTRQQAQRAFAVEFMMPFRGLYDRVGGNFSDESIEEAANYYGGSPIAAKLQFENNKGQILRAA